MVARLPALSRQTRKHTQVVYCPFLVMAESPMGVALELASEDKGWKVRFPHCTCFSVYHLHLLLTYSYIPEDFYLRFFSRRFSKSNKLVEMGAKALVGDI